MAELLTPDTAHLDRTETALKTITTKSFTHADPQEHIHSPSSDQSQSYTWLRTFFPYASLEDFENQWHLGNYVLDRSTGRKTFEPMSIYVRLGMHLLYYGSQQENVLHWKRTQVLLREQSVKMGRQYDDPASRKHVLPFIRSFGLEGSLEELVEPDWRKYATFNDFFSREIRADARPVAEMADGTVVSSAADCRFTAYPTVDLATRYWIKGFGFTVAKLLDSTTEAGTFEGGSLVIQRLAPQDYHRWHAPVDGTVVSIREIPGTYYTVNPQAINQEGTLDVFCENRRSVMILRRPSGASVAVVAIGAMLVGSVRYVDGIGIGKEVKRGQCLGMFRYGGSTVVSVFQKGDIVLDEDLVRNSCEEGCETYVKVGWRVGG